MQKRNYKAKGIDASTYLFDVTDEAAVDKGITAIEKEVGPDRYPGEQCRNHPENSLA